MGLPKNKIKLAWSPKFAYAIGLITTDGNLAKDKRHINLTSKDKDLIDVFIKCLKLRNKISLKTREKSKIKKYYFIQFGDVNFYKFLIQIGLMSNKSKIIAEVKIPKQYFKHFLRGCFDGDGSFISYWDPRWKSSFMFYTEFISASKKYIHWLRQKNKQFFNINGHIIKTSKRSIYYLKYAKRESLILLKSIYDKKSIFYLKRKYLKIKKALSIIGVEI